MGKTILETVKKNLNRDPRTIKKEIEDFDNLRAITMALRTSQKEI